MKASPWRRSAPPPANVPSLSFGPCRSTRMPIGRPVSSSTSRIIATRSRIPSCEAWLMLMRKTSAPAANRAAIVLRSAEAGPRVAMILTRRRRACNGVPPTIWRCLRRRSPPRSFFRPAGTANRRCGSGVCLVGQLHRPALGVLAGVDFEEAGAVVAAPKAILPAVDLELTIRRAHEPLALPLAAALVHCVEIIILSRQGAAQKRHAVERFEVPPAFAGPVLPIGIADGDANAVTGVVAHAQVRAGRSGRAERRSERKKRQQSSCDSVHVHAVEGRCCGSYSARGRRCQPRRRAQGFERLAGRCSSDCHDCFSAPSCGRQEAVTSNR